MSLSTRPESTGGPAGRLGCRRAPVLCPCGGQADSGQAVRTLANILLCLRPVLAPEGPWVEDGRALPVLALWGCCNKTPYTRRLVDGNVYFSGWKSGFLVPQIPGLARA